MEAAFLKHIEKQLPELQGGKLLVAVSGGIDSMVLLHLCISLDLDIHVAHCNFHLRDLDSIADQKFVQQYCQEHKITCFVQEFDTIGYAQEHKVSIQIAARELRYTWFDQLVLEHSLDYILTAHHLDDAMETFLINFTRGTGIEGLLGIPEVNAKIVRPLLCFTRQDIEQYANCNCIVWQEDRTNAETKYVRNKIRKQVLPVLKDMNTNFAQSFKNTVTFLEQTSTMAHDASVMFYQQVATQKGDQVHFSIPKLKQLPHVKAYLHAWFAPYGFKAFLDIFELITAESGKVVFGTEFVLLKNREELILAPKSSLDLDSTQYVISKDLIGKDLPIDLELKLLQTSVSELGHNKEIYIDYDKVEFPLVLRKWDSSDVFYPFGMKGKKKISKYFKDEKFSLIDKQNTWLLCCDNQIIWIVGHRMDERYKITKTTTKILKIKLNQ